MLRRNRLMSEMSPFTHSRGRKSCTYKGLQWANQADIQGNVTQFTEQSKT